MTIHQIQVVGFGLLLVACNASQPDGGSGADSESSFTGSCSDAIDVNRYTPSNPGCGGYSSGCKGQLHIVNHGRAALRHPVIRFSIPSGVRCTRTHAASKWTITDDGSTSHTCVFTARNPDAYGHYWSIAGNGGTFGFGFDTSSSALTSVSNPVVSDPSCRSVSPDLGTSSPDLGTSSPDLATASSPDLATSSSPDLATSSNPDLATNNTGGWQLTWSDEFNGANGSAPDPNKWVYDIGWGDGGWGNNELEYYTSTRDNSYIQDGSLVIAARTDNLQSSMVCGSSACKYTSARLKTLGKFSQQYGRFEARIKIPTGSGMWPAFWTMGDNFPTVDWPACGEIDVMENWGSDGTVIAGTTHDPGYDSENGISGEYTFSSITTVANDYHVYAMEWDASAIRFYVDGNEYHCVRKPGAPASACGAISGTIAQPPHTWPFDHPFFMLLNLAIDSSSDNLPNSSTKFPALMLVDYVRVYQQ
jgi:beta-glucanase (GH16 family)